MSEKWVPHGYQKDTIKFMLSHGCAGALLAPGMGKSSITLAVFKILKAEGLVERMLIIAPLRVAHSVWPREVEKWDDFTGLKVHVLHGPNKDELLAEPHDISVINPEGLPWLFGAAKEKKWFWDMLVVDESSRFKHSNTLRFKTLKPWLNHFKRRYILTGTPAPNGLLDLFGQIYILDLGNALGRYITHYRNSYFDATGYGGYTWVLRKGAEEKIYERLKPLVLRMSGEQYLSLPPLVNNTIEVELPPKARKAYAQMEALLITEIEGKTLTAANAAAATNKCRQIANGGSYFEVEGALPGMKKWQHVHDAKTEAVQDLVEELGGKPALIAYEFRHDLDRLQKAFPDAPYLGGGVTPQRQREIEDGWNAGQIPVLLAQPQSVAHGLNLQGVGAAVIWYSLTWDLENYEQFVRRVWRQGQKERVVNHHIVAKDTVDAVVMKALQRKDKVQRSLLDALSDHLKGRRK